MRASGKTGGPGHAGVGKPSRRSSASEALLDSFSDSLGATASSGDGGGVLFFALDDLREPTSEFLEPECRRSVA